MTTDRLAKHYSALSPDERFALALAAAARQDEVEVDRLAAAAERTTYRVPDVFPLFAALQMTASLARMKTLEVVAFFHVTMRLVEQRDDDTRSRSARGRMAEVGRAYGHLVLARSIPSPAR